MHNCSTFFAQPGIYLEDLFVRPAHRGKGHGTALLQALARIAVERGCGRFEWAVLDWNTPSIEFHRSLGAKPMHDWTVLRLAGEALRKLVGYSERNRAALKRIIQAGGKPISWAQLLCELQRDWARKETAPTFAEILFALEGH